MPGVEQQHEEVLALLRAQLPAHELRRRRRAHGSRVGALPRYFRFVSSQTYTGRLQQGRERKKGPERDSAEPWWMERSKERRKKVRRAADVSASSAVRGPR